MNNHFNDRRKTLPEVKVEKDLEEDNLPKRVLPILAAPHISSIQESDDENITDIMEKENAPLNVVNPTAIKPQSAVPSWLRLNSDDDIANRDSSRMRHSIGLDVPGAVHTITTPSKFVQVDIKHS
jgi:6-phosphofructo-2-kinase